MVTLRCNHAYLKTLALGAALFFLALALPAQGQVFSRGVPASVSSPGPDGQPKGIPSSVTSPVQFPADTRHHGAQVFRSHGPLRHFGPRDHRRNVVVPVPLFYPIYYGEGNVADPYVPAPTDPAAQAAEEQAARESGGTREDELRQAYLEGAREALAQERNDSRYRPNTEYADRQRTRSQASEEPPRRSRPAEASEPPKDDNAPTAVFIFKDGHKLETKNFAIMGTTLYDLSSGSVKKVQLAELDKDATTKANDDRGIQVKLPQ